MGTIERYRLSPAWHVLEVGTGEYGQDRGMAAASSAADGDAIVDALNQHRGAVEALRRIVHRAEEPCGPHQAPLPYDVAWAEQVAIAKAALDRLGGQ